MARRGRRDRYLNAPQASDDKFKSTQAEIEQDGAMNIGRILLQRLTMMVKTNEMKSNDAERQRDDQMRNDDFVRNLNSQQ